jgi:hypothetical protein
LTHAIMQLRCPRHLPASDRLDLSESLISVAVWLNGVESAASGHAPAIRPPASGIFAQRFRAAWRRAGGC